MRTLQPIMLLMFTCLLFSCQKEPDATNLLPTNNCRPVSGSLYDINGAVGSTVRYEYTNDRLTKVILDNNDFITYEYSGNNVIKRSFFEAGETVPYAFQTLSYNANGGISKLVYSYDDFFGSIRDSALFSYNGGKLASIQGWTQMQGEPYQLEADYDFTFTGNNITKIVTNSYTDGNLDDTEIFLFTFDTKPNYFQKQTPRFLQTDPFFMEIDPVYYALILSANNVTGVQDSGPGSPAETITYQADDKGNLTEMQIDGMPVLRYAYECK